MRVRERDALRRRRFRAWFKEALKGDRKLLMQKTGLSKGRVTQLLDEKDTGQPFGEDAAATLTGAFKLAADYFDRMDEPIPKTDDSLTPAPQAQSPALERTTEIDGVELTKDAIALVRAWMALPLNKRNKFKREIETASLEYQEPVPNASIPKAFANPEAATADARTSAGRDADKPKTAKKSPRKPRGEGMQ